jgi:hypothetical protein
MIDVRTYNEHMHALATTLSELAARVRQLEAMQVPAAGAVGTHHILSLTHTDSTPQVVSQGSLIVGDKTPSWNELVLGGVTGSVLTRTITDVIWSDAGFTIDTTAKAAVDQSNNAGAIPVLRLDQADVSEEAIYFIGTSDAATADQTLVDPGDFTTPGAIIAWVKVVVEDTRVGGIGTVDGWIPIYAIPTA